MRNERAENFPKKIFEVCSAIILRSRRFRSLSIFLFHLLVFALAYLFAYLIRFDFDMDNPDWAYPQFIKTVGYVLIIKTIFFLLDHHFKNAMFFASTSSLKKVFLSSFYSFFVFLFLNIGVRRFDFPLFVSSSLGILVLDFGLTIFLLGGTKFIARYIKEDIVDKRSGENQLKPAYMIGANTEIGRVANMINSRKTTGFYVAGFITSEDEEYKVKMEIDYIPIIGTFKNFMIQAAKNDIQDILIIAGFLPGPQFRKLFDICHANGINLHVIPQSEIATSQTIPIRRIEINDLLKRNPVYLDTSAVEKEIQGKRILVTGAGGSIGSEICRQLLQFKPSELYILGRGENRIFFLDRELKALTQDVKIIPIIADVTNAERIEDVFQAIRPQFVYHAAAHKHVPLMEANVSEAIRNNIYGTKVVADAANKYGVERFVLISTDKAVNPTSIMGSSKHMAERYVNAIAENSKTKFIVTRFGNVLGSTGSVVPIFKSQIEKGGPITITDFRMTRFFMTIPEASQLVLEASVMGKGGEIFILDMGQPVHIVDLAKDMIRLAGLPDDSIEIKEVGLRPGEKLYEELYFESEKQLNTPHPKLYAACHREFKLDVVQNQIQFLLDLTQVPNNSELIRQKIREYIPEFQN